MHDGKFKVFKKYLSWKNTVVVTTPPPEFKYNARYIESYYKRLPRTKKTEKNQMHVYVSCIYTL